MCAGDGRLRACVRVSACEGGEEGGMRTPRATDARVREGAEGVTFGADFDFGLAYDFDRGSGPVFEREDGHASALSRAAPASAPAREQEQGGHSTASTRRAQALARVSGRVATRAPAPARTRRAPGTGARAARAGTAGARAAGSTAAAAVCVAMMSFSPSSSSSSRAEAEAGAGGRDAGGGSTAARVRACVAARAEAAMPVPVPVVLVHAAGPVLRAHVSFRAHALPVLLRLPRRRCWRRAGGAAGARGAAGM